MGKMLSFILICPWKTGNLGMKIELVPSVGRTGLSSSDWFEFCNCPNCYCHVGLSFGSDFGGVFFPRRPAHGDRWRMEIARGTCTLEQTGESCYR